MKTPFALTFVCVTAMLVTPAPARVVTLVIKGQKQNDAITIGAGEIAQVQTFIGSSAHIDVQLRQFQGFRIDPDRLMPASTLYMPNLRIAGPAVLTLSTASPPEANSGAWATIEVAPESFPPGQTLILPPGTNQVAVTLECSTNLLTWSSATNGVYGSPTEAKFFRIKAEKLP